MKWILTGATVAALSVVGLAWAENHASKPAERRDHHGMMQGGMMQGGMMRGGMMSMMGNMMRGNGAGMMDECAGMMRDMNSGSTRPNEQWRRER